VFQLLALVAASVGWPLMMLSHWRGRRPGVPFWSGPRWWRPLWHSQLLYRPPWGQRLVLGWVLGSVGLLVLYAWPRLFGS